MKRMRRRIVRVAGQAVLMSALALPAHATGLVYEGQLQDGGQPANGRYDIRITPYAGPDSGRVQAAPMTFADVAVSEGRFRVEFELPAAVAADAWIEVGVRDTGRGAPFNAIEGRTKAVAAGPIGACWSTTGDSGSNPATNFLGTTDAQPLVLRVQDQRVGRYEPSATLFNGVPNTANVILGSASNSVAAGVRGATISGGGTPSGNSDPDLFTEGSNQVTDIYGTVAGGYANRAGDDLGTVVDRGAATVGGGFGNIAAGASSTVAGGEDNKAIGARSTVAGGEDNAAFGAASFVAGGESNCAGGYQSWAGGLLAKVRPGTDPGFAAIACSTSEVTFPGGVGDAGTFAWADHTTQSFVSNGDDRFLVRASGGLVFQRAIGAETDARAPRGYFNVVSGDSGLGQPASALTNTVATFENGGDAFIRVIAPSASDRGIIFGDSGNVSDGGVVYQSTNVMEFRTNGNVTRMTIGDTGIVDLTALGAAGAVSLCRNTDGEIASCSSSARYKERIAPLGLGLAEVEHLRPVSFQWKNNGAADLGFVAEEVAGIDPRLVTHNEQGEIEGVKYERLSAVLVGAMQEMLARERARTELQGERDAAQAQALAELQAENRALRDGLAELQQRIAGNSGNGTGPAHSAAGGE